MKLPDFLTGLNPLETRLIEVCRSLAENEKVFINAVDLLKVIAMDDWGMDEEDFEEECEELAGMVYPIEDYEEESVGFAYRTLLRMGLPWRNRYPYFVLAGMTGDPHDEVPFGPESVEARLSKSALILFPIHKKPLLPGALLNGVLLKNGYEVPPHNLEEIWMAMEQVRQEPDVTVDELMEILPGPDFGAGGIVGGFEAIKSLYGAGKGPLTLRSKIDTIIDGGRTRIEVRSLPHGVLINTALAQIKNLNADDRLPGFLVKDHSEGKTLRIVIDMQSALSAEELKTLIFKETDLERTVQFQCGYRDDSGWLIEGPMIDVLKEAVAQCTSGWHKKSGDPIEFVPFFREMMKHGGYKNPLSKLADERKTAVYKMDRP